MFSPFQPPVQAEMGDFFSFPVLLLHPVQGSLQLPVEFVMPSRAMASLHSHINLGKPGLKKVTTSICNVHSEQAEAWDPRDEARVKPELNGIDLF